MRVKRVSKKRTSRTASLLQCTAVLCCDICSPHCTHWHKSSVESANCERRQQQSRRSNGVAFESAQQRPGRQHMCALRALIQLLPRLCRAQPAHRNCRAQICAARRRLWLKQQALSQCDRAHPTGAESHMVRRQFNALWPRLPALLRE